MSPSVSVVIPCRNEEKHIEHCIRSIITNGYPQELLEILIIDGDSTDKTRDIISNLQEEFQQVILINNPKKVTPVALNLGIKHATKNYTLIASAHSSFEKNYISILVNEIQTLPNAIAVGGIMHTKIKNITPISLAIQAVLTHPFGVGNSVFRIGTTKIKEVDTVPFGLYKSELLKQSGGYNELLIRNHDMELSKRLTRISHGKIYLIPEAECNYFARENYGLLSKNNYGNGKWNILTVFITKTFSSLSIRHFVPLLFLFSIILPVIASIFWFPFIYLSVLSLICYTMVMTYFSIKLHSKSNNIFYNLLTFYVLHLSYGMGSLIGVFQIPFHKK
jgi:glycosyltransferase involved in cell wall biosynthesis